MDLTHEMLDMSHLNEFNSAIKLLNSPFSEYSFANLYLFRLIHDYRVLRQDGNLFLQGQTHDGTHYIMPFSPLASISKTTLRKFMEQGFSLFPIASESLNLFADNEYEHMFNIDDSDYVYTLEKIALYPGRKLHKKRNLVKQYRTSYSYEDRTFTCELAQDAMTALDSWFQISELPIEDTDYKECADAIGYCNEFGLSGQVYYADGVPSGFLLGEELNNNTFVIHFAKGNTTFKGIYPHMYNSLAESLSTKYEFLNFEQDLGKESLRQAKSTYITDMMRDKYRIRLKQ